MSIVLIVAVAWLLVIAAVVVLCRMAQQGDRAQLAVRPTAPHVAARRIRGHAPARYAVGERR